MKDIRIAWYAAHLRLPLRKFKPHVQSVKMKCAGMYIGIYFIYPCQITKSTLDWCTVLRETKSTTNNKYRSVFTCYILVSWDVGSVGGLPLMYQLWRNTGMTGKDPGYVSLKIHSSVLLSDMRTNCHSCKYFMFTNRCTYLLILESTKIYIKIY